MALLVWAIDLVVLFFRFEREIVNILFLIVREEGREVPAYTSTNRCVRHATRPSLSESFLAVPLLHSFSLLCSSFCIKKQIFTKEVFGKIVKPHIFGTKSQNGSATAKKYGLETLLGLCTG